MKIEVFHQDFEKGGYIHVADVTIPEQIAGDVDRALEYAWRWTNNVDGSWSQDISIDGCDNGDWNENVQVVAPLPVHLGRTYGHRSSMVRDKFVVDGKPYKVASFGFEEM